MLRVQLNMNSIGLLLFAYVASTLAQYGWQPSSSSGYAWGSSSNNGNGWQHKEQKCPHVCGSSKPITILLTRTSPPLDHLAQAPYNMVQLLPDGKVNSLGLAIYPIPVTITNSTTNITTTTIVNASLTNFLTGNYKCKCDGAISVSLLLPTVDGTPLVASILFAEYDLTLARDCTYSVVLSIISCPAESVLMGSCSVPFSTILVPYKAEVIPSSYSNYRY